MHCSEHYQTQDGVLPSQYQLHGHTLSIETEAKYLGVKITADLRWDTHITDVCNKANKTLGFLRRNSKTLNERLKNAAYKTFVRPVLEYASPVWDPSTANNIKALEKVQRRAVGWVKQDYRRSARVDTLRQQLLWRKAAKASTPHRLLQVPPRPHTHLVKTLPFKIRPPQENHPAHSQPHLRHSIPPDSI